MGKSGKEWENMGLERCCWLLFGGLVDVYGVFGGCLRCVCDVFAICLRFVCDLFAAADYVFFVLPATIMLRSVIAKPSFFPYPLLILPLSTTIQYY
jgi:hypothetical protein